MTIQDLERPEYQLTDHMKEAGTHWLMANGVPPQRGMAEMVESFWKHLIECKQQEP